MKNKKNSIYAGKVCTDRTDKVKPCLNACMLQPTVNKGAKFLCEYHGIAVNTAQWDNHRVALSWNILYLRHIYSNYVVEKSPDGKRYAPVSENATVLADRKDKKWRLEAGF